MAYTVHVEFVLASTPYGAEDVVRRAARKHEVSSGFSVTTGTRSMEFAYRTKVAAVAARLRFEAIPWVGTSEVRR